MLKWAIGRFHFLFIGYRITDSDSLITRLRTTQTINSGSEKTANSNSIDQKTTPPTDDPACSDVSLHNKSSLDSAQSPMLPKLEPINQVGGLLLSANEANVRILRFPRLQSSQFIRSIPTLSSDLLHIKSTANHIYHNENRNAERM